MLTLISRPWNPGLIRLLVRGRDQTHALHMSIDPSASIFLLLGANKYLNSKC